MIRVAALLLAFCFSPLRAEEARYSLADLKALDKTGQWEELLNHLDDVPTAQKTEAWEAMGIKAAEKHILSIDTDEEPFTAITTADALLTRYKFLRDNDKFKKARRKVAVKGLESCFNLSYTGAACIERMQTFIANEPNGSELAFRLGKATVKNGKVAEAVLFFKKYLDGKSERLECTDEEVVGATVAALELPGENPLVPEGREIASSLCSEKMHPLLVKALAKKKKGSDFAKNSCRFLKEGGGLGKAEDACRR